MEGQGLLVALAVVVFYGKVCYSLLLFCYRRLLSNPIDLQTTYGADGTWWALVTGATDGIGKAYAFALAAKGLNIVLVSRSEAKLAIVKEQIKAKHPQVLVETVQIDFVEDDPELYSKRLAETVKDLKIGVLVNNVGMSHVLNLYHRLSTQTICQTIHCNVISFSVVSKVVLAKMYEQKSGVVINVSSLVTQASCVLSFLNVYGATKAYMDFLSQVLLNEYNDYGITVQTFNPGFVATNMTAEVSDVVGKMTEADEVVKTSLDNLGVRSQLSDNWTNEAKILIMRHFPTLSRTIVLPYLKQAAQSKGTNNEGRCPEFKME